MTKKDKVIFVINKLEELYPRVPIPLNHSDPYTLLVSLILKLKGKTPIVYLRSDGYGEYRAILGRFGPLIYHLMFYIASLVSNFISARKYILREVIRLKDMEIEFGGKNRLMNVKSAFIPETRVQVYFLQDDDYFKPLTQLLYKAKNGRILNDNDVRFALFAKVALDTLKRLYWKPDIIVCSDWQMSFVPQLLKQNYADDEFYSGIKTVSMIHSLNDFRMFSKKSYDMIDLESDSKGDLIDNYASRSGYAIWGFEQTYHYSADGQYYNNQKLDYSSLNFLDDLLDNWSQSDEGIKALGFLSYDVKNIFYPHINFKNTNSALPYIWFIKPKLVKSYNIDINYSKSNELLLSRLKPTINLSQYRNLITAIKSELKAGNSYQINLTMKNFFEIHKNPIDSYLQIRNYAKPQYGYYLNIGKQQVLSFSPEQFFYTDNDFIYTYPMKGTIKRSENNLVDNQLKKNLYDSIKDKAEHIMIVD